MGVIPIINKIVFSSCAFNKPYKLNLIKLNNKNLWFYVTSAEANKKLPIRAKREVSKRNRRCLLMAVVVYWYYTWLWRVISRAFASSLTRSEIASRVISRNFRAPLILSEVRSSLRILRYVESLAKSAKRESDSLLPPFLKMRKGK